MVSLTRPVTVMRDGHPVIAHYGSVATEVAVCVKHAGIVERPELGVLELLASARSLEQLLAKTLGERAPGVGAAVRAGGAWCARPDAGRALIVAPRGSIGRWRRLVQRSTAGGGSVTCRDVAVISAASLIGPRAARVLAAAGVGEALLPGAAVAGTLAGAAAVVLCEASNRFLLLVEAGAGSPAWPALDIAGASHGLAHVGHDAYERLSAASRPALLAG